MGSITWGAWEYSGGNGMRVGMSWDISSVSNSSSRATITVKIYTQNQYSYNDGQTLVATGDFVNDTSFTNNDGTGAVLRETKALTHTYGSASYGSSPGTWTFGATISGAYNGVTPSISRTATIPARPIATPVAPDSVSLSPASGEQFTMSWSRNSTNARPYEAQYTSSWHSASNEWSSEISVGAGVSSYTTVGSVAGRRYRGRVRAVNSAGTSGHVYSDYIQTTPTGPSSASATKSSTTSISIKWTNNQSSANGYTYTNLIEEKVGTGAWTQIASVSGTTTSYSRTGRSPGLLYQYRVRAYSNVGESLYSGYSTTGTVQLQAAPAAPSSFAVSMSEDASASLSWVNNSTADAPYSSIVVQREENGVWSTVATLTGSSTSLTSTGTTANKSYRWRLQAKNDAGSSAYVTSGYFNTTPATPEVTKTQAVAGGGMRVTWLNNVGYTGYTTEVRYYDNGSATPSAAITVASGVTSYTLTGVDLTHSYRFEIRAVSTVGRSTSSAWTTGVNTPASTVPDAPSNLAPNSVVIDLLRDTKLSWLHNPSLDEAEQTAYRIQASKDNGTTWLVVGEWTSAENSHTATPADWSTIGATNGTDVLWRVATKGIHANWSAYSASAQLFTSTTPTVSLVAPLATLTGAYIDVEWSYFDQEGTTQAGWELELFDANNVTLEERSGDDTTTSLRLDTLAQDGTIYTLRVRVLDSAGLWSDWLEQDVTAAFIPPAMPEVEVVLDSDTGSYIVSTTPTTPVEGVSVEATSVSIQRAVIDPETGVYGDWETIGSGLPVEGSFADAKAPIDGTAMYRAIPQADTLATAVSSNKPTSAEERWVYVAGGANFGLVCKMWANVEIKITDGRERSLHRFAGRQRPIVFSGAARSRVYTVSGTLEDEATPPEDWGRLARNSDVVLFRDPLGRKAYGALSDVSTSLLSDGLYTVSFSVTEVMNV